MYIASIITLNLVLLVCFYGDEYRPVRHYIVVGCTPIQLHNLHDIVQYQILDGVEVHCVSIFSFRLDVYCMRRVCFCEKQAL